MILIKIMIIINIIITTIGCVMAAGEKERST